MPPKEQHTDVAVRKKKNADAQAAFRQRRANYISTLEETVTNLESVVLQLQESCREARAEAQDLRHENSRLRQALRDRENFWRAVWPRKGQSSDSDGPPSFNSQIPVTQCTDHSIYSSGATYSAEHDSLGHRSSAYSWPQPIAQTSSSGGESAVLTGSASNSPQFSESPTLNSSEMAFMSRFPPEDQKVSMENQPYYNFHEGSAAVHDRTQDFDYRRQTTHPGEVTLHGGTADISLAASGTDAVRYRLGSTARSSDRPLLPILPPLSAGSDNGSQHEPGSSDGDSNSYLPQKLRSRRDTTASRPSRSPSPGMAPLSGTLAVIKAQAFGALRRTRVRSRKSTDGPAKVALDVLEARGIGMGGSHGVKRQRLDDDNDLDVPS
ncbi:hypothetical protein D9758_000259 [Tetrapyrgos nigripes]|uniref:BZIP domain-containing protein n=1 Tax=Tetrapyrgos nigripes TaxID=182062 RepID=A0A8H5H1R2_9AGAR|nr:hypothetical protein D9758_000259 [Tetrapyrgos nigripes]